MAIIKRTPRPGELVRGATAGNLVAFGPDGETVDSGKATENLLELPEGGSEGDILGKGTDGPEWVPHYPAGGSVGDNLSLGSDGPEWTTPSGGGSLGYVDHTITPLSISAGDTSLVSFAPPAALVGKTVVSAVRLGSSPANLYILSFSRFSDPVAESDSLYILVNNRASIAGSSITVRIFYI